MSFTSHNKGLEAFFVAISQRRRQVEPATLSRVVYTESIIYMYSVIDSTDSNACNLAMDTPIGEVNMPLDREKQPIYVRGLKSLISKISARRLVLPEMVTIMYICTCVYSAFTQTYS